jgi:hypothetical protein
MFGSVGEEGQPAAEDGDRFGHGVRPFGAAEAGGPAEQAGEGDAGRVGQQELRRVGVPDAGLAAADGLLGGEVAVDVRENDRGELRGEGETLVPVTRLGDDEQSWCARVVAGHRGQRGVGLAGQGQRDEDQRPRADLHVADGAGGLRGSAVGRQGAGQRR